MNNYCSNCGHALEGNERACPECGYQILSNRVLNRRIQWNLVMKLNFTLVLFISLTLILVLSSVAGIDHGSYGDYVLIEEITFAFGMLSLFGNTLLAFTVFFISRTQFLIKKCTDQQWLTTLYLSVLSLLIWIPFITVWTVGNW